MMGSEGGSWYLLEGDRAQAQAIFLEILEPESQWAVFGCIATAVEVACLGEPER